MDYIYIIIALMITIIVSGLLIYGFCQLTREKQIEIVKEWLLLAVVQAEKELGQQTGQLKLRYVYDLFTNKFKVLALMIPFEQFSGLVDEALDTMREMISSNKAVQDYINK